jgi:hypothetical protein
MVQFFEFFNVILLPFTVIKASLIFNLNRIFNYKKHGNFNQNTAPKQHENLKTLQFSNLIYAILLPPKNFKKKNLRPVKPEVTKSIR